MLKITERRELIELARELGVRPDWHEPNEQELTAAVFGTSFDNAGFWPKSFSPDDGVRQEMFVVIYRTEWNEEQNEQVKSEPLAAVNLATLFAWATGFQDGTPELTQIGHTIEKSHASVEADRAAVHGRARGLREAASLLEGRADEAERKLR